MSLTIKCTLLLCACFQKLMLKTPPKIQNLAVKQLVMLMVTYRMRLKVVNGVHETVLTKVSHRYLSEDYERNVIDHTK